MNHGMEDYVFAQHRKLNGYDLGLYAIFDGHAGPDVAKYLQNHLFQNILSEVYTLVIDILYISVYTLLFSPPFDFLILHG